MIDLDLYVDFIIKHKLTQTQLLLLHLIYKDRKDLINKYKKAFPSEDNSMIPKYLVNDLFEKKLLVRKNKNGVEVVKVGQTFLNIFVDKFVATEEIYDIYPTHYINNGVQVPLSAMDINIFANLYEDAIMGSLEEHEEVKKDIKYAIKNNMLNIGIEKFVKSKHWKQVRKHRIKNIEVTNIKIDSIHDF